MIQRQSAVDPLCAIENSKLKIENENCQDRW